MIQKDRLKKFNVSFQINALMNKQNMKKTFRYNSESLVINVVRERGLEPPHLAAPDPKSGASAIPPFPHMNFYTKYDNKYHYKSF